MQTIPNKRILNLSALVCVLGHDYIITNTITPNIMEYKCSNCGREVTEDPEGNLQLLTEKSRTVNQCVGSFIRKKTNRIKMSI